MLSCGSETITQSFLRNHTISPNRVGRNFTNLDRRMFCRLKHSIAIYYVVWAQKNNGKRNSKQRESSGDRKKKRWHLLNETNAYRI